MNKLPMQKCMCGNGSFWLDEDFSLICNKCREQYVIAVVRSKPTGWSLMKKKLVEKRFLDERQKSETVKEGGQ